VAAAFAIKAQEYRRYDMKRLSVLFCFLLVFLLLTFPVLSVEAVTLYMSPTGTDTGSYPTACTDSNNPCKTLAYTYSRSRPGDTIYIRGGTNTLGGSSLSDGGGHGTSTGDWTYIKNYPGESPTFSSGSLSLGVKYLDMSGLTFTGLKTTTSNSSQHIYIHGNRFTGPEQQWSLLELYGCGGDCVFESNEFYITSGSHTDWHGAYLECGHDITFRGNTFHGAHGYGLQIYAHQCGDVDTVLVEGNTFYSNSTRCGIEIGFENGSNNGDVLDVTIQNNLFYSNGCGIRSSLYGGEDMYRTKVYNNTFYSTGNALDLVTNVGDRWHDCEFKNNVVDTRMGMGSYCTNWTLSNNLYVGSKQQGSCTDKDYVVGDPSYVSEGTDFHIKSDSDAIDAGATLASVTDDKDGVSRPQGAAYDIGAYEYSSGTNTTPRPEAPQDLRVIRSQ
jgi:hypothetical protein